MPKTLYICYFGLLEPLVQTQVLPYLREIKKGGVDVTLLTFEPEFRKMWTAERIEAERAALAAEGIDWHCLGYHKWPSVPATFYDILNGTRRVRKLLGRENFDILHCRVHLPALMAAAARKFSRKKPKILFDIRGFFPEEYTDAGVWPEGGWLYRTAKRVEKWLLKEADGFVVLTEKARDILFPESRETGFDKSGRPVEVIPCCVELNRFKNVDQTTRAETRRSLGVEDRRVIIYVGSFGGWYLTEAMMDLFTAAVSQNENTFILILTQRDKEKVVENFRKHGFSDEDFLVRSVEPAEIGEYLAAADLAISFIKACYSKLSSSPTKIAEYLAAGLPIIANPGVGDVDALILGNDVGALVQNFDQPSYVMALTDIENLGDVGSKCRAVAKRDFDISGVGGEGYRRIYSRLLKID